MNKLIILGGNTQISNKIMIWTKLFLFLQCHYASCSPFLAPTLVLLLIGKLVIFFFQFGNPGKETIKTAKLWIQHSQALYFWVTAYWIGYFWTIHLRISVGHLLYLIETLLSNWKLKNVATDVSRAHLKSKHWKKASINISCSSSDAIGKSRSFSLL